MLSQNGMPLIGECSEEENSREQLATQRTQSSRTEYNASEMSGVAQNLQQFIQNVTTLDLKRVPNLTAIRQDDETEEVISHLPYKRSGSATRADSERSGSQVTRQGKQVRFNIRDSLKNIMNACDEQPLSDQENSQTIANQAQQPRKLSKSKKLKPEARLKFIRPSSQDNRSSNSRERSPCNMRVGSREPSCETNKTSDSQKPRKTKVSQQSKQLALKYKLNADEMKRKKYGIEPTFYDMVVLSNYSTDVLKREESRETPNFSAAVTRRDISNQESLASSHSEVPAEVPSMQEPLQAPSMNTEEDLYFENINYQEQQSQHNEAQIGTIIRNHGNSRTSIDRKSSFDSSIKVKPGTIVRQRSQSPSMTLNLSNVGRRQSQASQAGSFVKIGSIVRNQSQQVLSPSQHNQTQVSNHILEKQTNFHYLQTSPGRSNQSFTYIANIDSSRLMPESPSQSSAAPVSRFDTGKHVFGTLWALLQGEPQVVRANLIHLQTHNQSIRTELLTKLSRHYDKSSKLAFLRVSLPSLIIGLLVPEAMQYLQNKEKRDLRAHELEESLRKWRKSPSSQLDQLKSELLRDIVSRLNQKLVIAVLRMKVLLNKQLLLHFQTYYHEYIAKPILSRAVNQFKAYTKDRQKDKEYIESARRALQDSRVRVIMRVWSSLRETREARSALLEEALERLAQLKLKSYFVQWNALRSQRRCKALGQTLASTYRAWRLRQLLFVRWVQSIKQQNKIKRKALQMLGQGLTASGLRHEDPRHFESRIENLKKAFDLRVRDIRDELSTFKTQKNKEPEKKTFNSAKRVQRKLDEMPISIRDVRHKPVDLDVKYQIHSALVKVQNSSRSNSAAKHYISDGRRSSSSHYKTNRLVFEQPSRGRSPAPNRLYSMLENKRQCPLTNTKFCLLEELKKKIIETLLRVKVYQNAKHYRVSLLANATDVLNKEEFKEGIADFIQYGLASQQSRECFQKLNATKQTSSAFAKWRARYLSRELKKQLSDIHTLNASKIAIREWQRALQQQRLWAVDLHRTKVLRRFYLVFSVWAKHTRDEAYLREKAVRRFRKKVCFDAWTKYLSNQGDVLMKIIKAQQHHNQVLISKALVSIFKHHLECLRVKNLRCYQVFRRYFKAGWLKAFKRQITLREVLNRRLAAIDQDQRDKYTREFEQKKQALSQWRERVEEKVLEIQTLTAQTHYRQTVVAKTFFYMKKLAYLAAGLRRMQHLFAKNIAPGFLAIAQQSHDLMSSEAHYRRYRISFQVTRVFNSWKEHVIHCKLARMIRQRRVLHKWYSHVYQKNWQLPLSHNANRLKYSVLKAWRALIQSQWNEKRSDIISRQFAGVKRQRTLKIVFLRLLENLLVSKRERLVCKQVYEFRASNLASKAFKLLKRRWLKRKKRRLLNLVARDFSASIKEKRDSQLRESLLSSTNDFEVLRLREVLEDPRKIILYRVINSWKSFIQDKVRKDTVVERFLLFKKRMMSLRCFLGWRSIIRYENSSISSQRQYDQRSAPIEQHERNVRFAGDSLQSQAMVDTRTYLFNHPQSSQSSQDHAHERVSATFGQRSLCSSNGVEFKGTSSLFDELDGIFKKNRQWLDDQREREEFLKEMASHYNTRLSQELMSSLRYSNDQYPSLALSLASKR